MSLSVRPVLMMLRGTGSIWLFWSQNLSQARACSALSAGCDPLPDQLTGFVAHQLPHFYVQSPEQY